MAVKGSLLHQEHEGDTWHKPPVKLANQFLVQRCHLLFAQMSKRFKARLNLLRCDVMRLSSDFLELDVSFLLVGHDVCHGDAVAKLAKDC